MFWGSDIARISSRMENQMEKTTDHQTEKGLIHSYRVRLVSSREWMYGHH